MSRHTRRSLRTPVLLLLVLVVLDVAAYVIAHAALLLVLGAVLAMFWLARGWFRPAAPAPVRPVLRVADDRDRLVAELDDARRSIAKLEQDAAANDELIGTLEQVAGRPVEVIIADYRRVQRQYGPAAVGKAGRRP